VNIEQGSMLYLNNIFEYRDISKIWYFFRRHDTIYQHFR